MFKICYFWKTLDLKYYFLPKKKNASGFVSNNLLSTFINSAPPHLSTKWQHSISSSSGRRRNKMTTILPQGTTLHYKYCTKTLLFFSFYLLGIQHICSCHQGIVNDKEQINLVEWDSKLIEQVISHVIPQLNLIFYKKLK